MGDGPEHLANIRKIQKKKENPVISQAAIRLNSQDVSVDINMDHNQPQSSGIPNVSTKTRFGVLEELEIDPESNKQTTTQAKIVNRKPPSLVITSQVNYKSYKNQIEQILNNKEFYLKYTPRAIKVHTNNISDYNKLIQNLDGDEAIEYFTFKPQEERTKRIVFKGPPGLDCEEIKEELKDLNFNVVEVIKMKGKLNTSHSYLVVLTKENNVGEIKKIKALSHLFIKRETFKLKVQNIRNVTDAKILDTVRVIAEEHPDASNVQGITTPTHAKENKELMKTALI